LGSESSARASYDAELLGKIDLLFQYFFHRSSAGAYIDSNNQMQFMYGSPDNNNNN
jgi:hypothetical protein